MKPSKNCYYLNKRFPAGGLRKALKLMMKGQSGQGWTREICHDVNHADGTSFSRNPARAELDLIDRIGGESACVRFLCFRTGKSECISISTPIYDGLLAIHVGANTLDRVIELQSIIAQALELTSATLEDARKLEFPELCGTVSHEKLEVVDDPTTYRAGIQSGNREPLAYPEKVTFRWLWDHVPISHWMIAGAVLLSAFSAGVTAAQIEWVKQTIDAFTDTQAGHHVKPIALFYSTY